MDFYKIVERYIRKDKIEIYPDFLNKKVEDLLVRGKDFYAVWNEEIGLWSMDPLDVQRAVDKDLWEYAEKKKNQGVYEGFLTVKTMESDSSGSWKRFVQYLKGYPDTKVRLDENLTFANTEVKKKDYVSRRLGYALEPGDFSAWDRLVGTLYSEKEREKIEWAIGAIVSGDSKTIQKFCVFYGEAGTGKSTIINIIQKLFDGYYVTFDAKSLGSSNNQFATEAFRSNPLVAIQHDGDLSRIEDNTRINSIVSHEMMTIKEKYKPEYTSRANCFLFLGTNRPVKITDAKSGIIRRLIDITPTGNLLKPKEYDALMTQIDFELGAIAYHCLEVYRELGKNYYKNYIPKEMIMKTDVFYNFVEANAEVFEEQTDGMSLKQAYSMYKEYCDDALVEFKLPRHKFREELKNYYISFEDVARIDGKQMRSWYTGFRKEKLEAPVLKKEEKSLPLVLDCDKSLLDDILADCPAQYGVDRDGSGNESPSYKWSDVKTKLSDLDTTKLHYILPKGFNSEGDGRKLIMMDFDIRNKNGEKDMLLNLEAASKYLKTYAEFSKGGCGVHLIYWYDGDVSKLSPLISEGVEVKVFRGNAAMRRRLSKCNNLPIAVMPVGGLPVKEEKMIDVTMLKDELHLRNIIKKCLRKENHGATRPEIDLIAKVLDDAYASGMSYDVSDIEHDVLIFAMNSTNQSDYCVKRVRDMKFQSTDTVEEKAKKKLRDDIPDSAIVFYDVEVFPNLFLVNWKVAGEGNPVIRMINPTPREIEDLFKHKLVGFNCRKYDNHILYGRYLGLKNEELYDLSHRIIVEDAKDAFYPEAYNVSYTDIYDFCSKKQSLKKWEIELGIHHQELGFPWDQPVPEELWPKVAEYCDNDVLATEAVWNARQADFTARRILADISGGSVNDTTNQLSTRFIFGDNRNPQGEFNYRNMGVDDKQLRETTAQYITFDTSAYDPVAYPDRKFKSYWSDAEDLTVIKERFERCKFTSFEDWHHVLSNDICLKPVFPGYKFDERQTKDKSTYRGEVIGEGGYVYAEPGIYTNVALLDIASMHPSSIIAEQLFGERYTARFQEILEARLAIKHKDFDKARKMFDGRLAGYLTDESTAKDLSGALKIVANSCYGLTSAKFPNPFRDPRNKDNIVAKRGALFMVNLKHEVQARGFTVAHIKTDSIKIPNATPEIIQFVMDYGKLYGYNFEHEATYERMCLVNDAVYIARYDNGEWTATGAQFQQPYVFKTLFSGEPLEFDDYCETKTVTGGAIYLDMNEDYRWVDDAEEELARRNYNVAHPEKPKKLNPEYKDFSDKSLLEYVSEGHEYQFVGRAGLFYPVKPGTGGGIMVREKNGKYYAVTGTKGYRWLEAEVVRTLHKEDDRDPGYYESLVNDAIQAINTYGDFESFVYISKPYDFKPKYNNPPGHEGAGDDDLPFDLVPCGDNKYNTCMDCPNCVGDICRSGYSLASFIETGGDA